MDYDNFLCKPLADYRKRLGIKTKTELSNLLEVNTDTYRKVEKGWRCAGLKKVIRRMFKYFQDENDTKMVYTLLEYCGVKLPELNKMINLSQWKYYKDEAPEDNRKISVAYFDVEESLIEFYGFVQKGLFYYNDIGRFPISDIFVWKYIDEFNLSDFNLRLDDAQ